MSTHFDSLYEQAIDLLQRLTTPNGILASSIEADNYKRIWARDSIICGLAGLMVNDEVITEGLKNSLLTLAQHQHVLGMIPSNVNPHDRDDVSFGSLVGRIDANTWFVVGSCSYYQATSDEEFWKQIEPAVLKCRRFLEHIEFNHKGWLYTPLSGNWADEYPIHGYTLYDNALRLWGERLWHEVHETRSDRLDQLLERTRFNFWPSTIANENHSYQPSAMAQLDEETLQHFIAFILPGRYDSRFDAAGNAIAMQLFGLDESQRKGMSGFLSLITSEVGQPLIPAFWPEITHESPDWSLLEGNYSYDFKNHPGAFHNGGIWPVWMGLFCLGLSQNGLKDEAKSVINAFLEAVQNNADWDFQEYIHARNMNLGGKTQMGYTASGIVFMKLALLA
ncbi:MAG: glycoside hydrolase 100 family protein [Bacteroidota bacterium]